MRLTIAARSILTVGLLLAFSLTLVGYHLERREHAALVAQAAARLDAQASLLMAELPGALTQGDLWTHYAGARTRTRVTVIASDGRVLADSEERADRMENHAGRPEFTQALAAGSGQDVRRSRSLGRDLVYLARAVPTASAGPLVLRLAVPLQEVAQGFGDFRRDFLVIAALSFLIAVGIAVLWARQIARQLRQMLGFAHAVSRGEMASRLAARSRDELGDLAEALNGMAENLQRTLRRLSEESRRSQTIMDSMGEGLVVLDPQGRIFLINPTGEALLDLRREAAVGQTLLEAVRSHELDDLLRAADSERTAARAEITLVHPRRRILGATAVLMRDADDRPQGTVLALRDITQIKRLEEMRMEFVLNVSHELRTPLTAIRGYAETLWDGNVNDPETARKFLEVIHRHAERLSRLLDDLLELSNIELERTPLQLRPVSVPDLCRQVVMLFDPQAERKPVHLRLDLAADCPPAQADRDRLMQILVNLVDNAVKYTPEGGTVTIGARLMPEGRGAEGPGSRGPGEQRARGAGEGGPDGGPMVEILVSDTGIGIPEKDLPRITERFYRVDKARSRELGGTGLGLAIVKHLVTAHGGRLLVESTLGAGTIVRVHLPAIPSCPSAPSA
jgi:two-component system phosphate regulon sensor histidine kinase PhoR